MNIILYGFKSCGKSTFGKLLADKLQWRFIDIDRVIEKLFQKKSDYILLAYKIYELSPETFRALEKQAVASLVDTDHAVIATGGGSVLDPENVVTLRKLGKLVYLQAPKHILKQRMLSGRLPTFLNNKDPDAAFEKMYLERENIYTAISDTVIEINNKSKHEVINEIMLTAIENQARRQIYVVLNFNREEYIREVQDGK